MPNPNLHSSFAHESGEVPQGSLFTRPDPVTAGYAAYTRPLLAVYDALVLGFSARYLWECPTTLIQALYDKHAGERHLDVGVGTGFYLDRCKFRSERPQITLFDANPTALEVAAKRIRRYEASKVLGSVMSPLPLPARSFDSIGLAFVMHCLPGPFAKKAVALLHLSPLLAKGGVLFGATVLGRGTPKNALAHAALRFYNQRGIFANESDDLESLSAALAQSFDRYELQVKGCVALFSAFRDV